MGNIIDYLNAEDRSFLDRPFNEIDSLVLSQSAYLHYGRFVPAKLPGGGSAESAPTVGAICLPVNAEALLERVGNTVNNGRLILALGASPRYRDIRLVCHVDTFDPSSVEQFSATTFLLPDGSAYVAFRGTDATFIGWREDFNMAFMTPVPSQVESLAYLDAVATAVASGPLRIGGHSKGGNLAVYASMSASGDIQSRILEVYSHDGPGFNENILLGEGFGRIQGKLHKTLPRSSVIGMLLQHQEKYRIVESTRSGIMQHDPFSWEIDEGNFIYAEGLSQSAAYVNVSLNAWLSSLTLEQREVFVDTLFSVLEATGAVRFKDLTTDWQSKARAALSAAKDVDKQTQLFVLKTIGQLLLGPVRFLAESLKLQMEGDDPR